MTKFKEKTKAYSKHEKALKEESDKKFEAYAKANKQLLENLRIVRAFKKLLPSASGKDTKLNQVSLLVDKLGAIVIGLKAEKALLEKSKKDLKAKKVAIELEKRKIKELTTQASILESLLSDKSLDKRFKEKGDKLLKEKVGSFSKKKENSKKKGLLDDNDKRLSERKRSKYKQGVAQDYYHMKVAIQQAQKKISKMLKETKVLQEKIDAVRLSLDQEITDKTIQLKEQQDKREGILQNRQHVINNHAEAQKLLPKYQEAFEKSKSDYKNHQAFMERFLRGLKKEQNYFVTLQNSALKKLGDLFMHPSETPYEEKADVKTPQDIKRQITRKSKVAAASIELQPIKAKTKQVSTNPFDNLKESQTSSKTTYDIDVGSGWDYDEE